MQGFIVSFKIEEQSAKFESMLTLLIEQSSVACLLRPRRMEHIENTGQIIAEIPSWPRWTSRPWIVAGKAREALFEGVYKGPFIEDCRKDGFNNQVSSLLENFDWAVFSYFTTYQSSNGCLLTCCSDIIGKTVTKVYHENVEISTFDKDPVSSLRTASFYDYELEGYFAYEISKANGEKPPLLLCCMGLEDCEENNWYGKHLEKLALVEEFVTDRWGVQVKNIICQVSDEQAYLDIWAEASMDHSIAEATFSANTDLKKLKSALSQSCPFEISKDMDDWSDWAYSQVYGGGSDEHHAIFRSKNPKITHQLWQWVGENQISRF